MDRQMANRHMINLINEKTTDIINQTLVLIEHLEGININEHLNYDYFINNGYINIVNRLIFKYAILHNSFINDCLRFELVNIQHPYNILLLSYKQLLEDNIYKKLINKIKYIRKAINIFISEYNLNYKYLYNAQFRNHALNNAIPNIPNTMLGVISQKQQAENIIKHCDDIKSILRLI